MTQQDLRVPPSPVTSVLTVDPLVMLGGSKSISRSPKLEIFHSPVPFFYMKRANTKAHIRREATNSSSPLARISISTRKSKQQRFSNSSASEHPNATNSRPQVRTHHFPDVQNYHDYVQVQGLRNARSSRANTMAGNRCAASKPSSHSSQNQHQPCHSGEEQRRIVNNPQSSPVPPHRMPNSSLSVSNSGCTSTSLYPTVFSNPQQQQSHSLQPPSMPYFSQQTNMGLVPQMNRSAGPIHLPHGYQIQNPTGQGLGKRMKMDDPHKILSVPSTVTPSLISGAHNLHVIQQETSNLNANTQYVKTVGQVAPVKYHTNSMSGTNITRHPTTSFTHCPTNIPLHQFRNFQNQPTLGTTAQKKVINPREIHSLPSNGTSCYYPGIPIPQMPTSQPPCRNTSVSVNLQYAKSERYATLMKHYDNSSRSSNVPKCPTDSPGCSIKVGQIPCNQPQRFQNQPTHGEMMQRRVMHSGDTFLVPPNGTPSDNLYTPSPLMSTPQQRYKSSHSNNRVATNLQFAQTAGQATPMQEGTTLQRRMVKSNENYVPWGYQGMPNTQIPTSQQKFLPSDSQYTQHDILVGMSQNRPPIHTIPVQDVEHSNANCSNPDQWSQS